MPNADNLKITVGMKNGVHGYDVLCHPAKCIFSGPPGVETGELRMSRVPGSDPDQNHPDPITYQ